MDSPPVTSCLFGSLYLFYKWQTIQIVNQSDHTFLANQYVREGSGTYSWGGASGEGGCATDVKGRAVVLLMLRGGWLCY